MKRIVTSIIGIFLCLFVLGNMCLAEKLEIGGNISHSLFYLLKKGELSQNITQYKLFLKKDFRGEKGKVYLSFKGGYDSIKEENVESLKLDEIYTDLYFKNTDLRVGQQIVSWGTADGINPTNYINPKEFSLTETEFKGKPLACLRAANYSKTVDITGVVVFDYQPQEIAEELEMGLRQVIPGLNKFPEPQEVENTLKNMEFALKAEKRINIWDVKISCFHGWEDYPALWIEYEPGFPPQFNAKSQYQRVNKVGLATAGSFKDIGLWSELAYVVPEKIEKMDLASTFFSMNEPYLQVVLGADYTFGDIYAEGQYIYCGNGSLISPYTQHQFGEKMAGGNYIMTQLSYRINRIHSLSLGGLINLNDYSYILMPQYTRPLSEVTELSLRGILFFGNKDTEFGILKDKELVSLGIKVSF